MWPKQRFAVHQLSAGLDEAVAIVGSGLGKFQNMSVLLEARRLSPSEIETYFRDGFMKYGQILTDEEVNEAREYVNQMVASLKPGERPEGFDMTHTKHEFMFDLCRHPRVLDVIEQFIGPNIVLFASHLICKPGGDGKAAPWHQDSTYWPLAPMRIMTLWLAIDEATTENGCMRVIPGTHTVGELAHSQQNTDENLLHLGLDISEFADEPIIDCVLKPGECTFHEARLVHGSSPNTSSKRRAGYTMRFMPVTTRLDRSTEAFYASHPLYLLRGEDRDGMNQYVNG